MQRAYHAWCSPALERVMELLVFGHAGSCVLAFPTRCGRFFDYENFGLLEPLRGRIEAGQLRVVCLDSVDQESFYCHWAAPSGRVQRHQQYEAYVLGEVLPFCEAAFGPAPTLTLGCSLGGFHAVNLALRHPARFVKAVGLSGRYDLTQAVDDFRDLLDGYRDDLVYFHTPNAYLPRVHEAAELAMLRRLELVLAVGECDPFRAQNEFLARALGQHGIRHALHVWSGRAHSPRSWSTMIGLYV